MGSKPVATATIVRPGVYSLNKHAKELIGSLQKRTIKGFVSYCFDGIEYASSEQCRQTFKKFFIIPNNKGYLKLIPWQ